MTHESAPYSLANTDRNPAGDLVGDLSQVALDAEYAAQEEGTVRERSHLYETGEQSDAIRSASRACHQSSGSEELDTQPAVAAEGIDEEERRNTEVYVTIDQDTSRDLIEDC